MSKELLLKVDSFNKPKEISGADTTALLLHHMIFSKRCFDIRQYRFTKLNEMHEVENRLKEYCINFFPEINFTDVSIVAIKQSYRITVEYETEDGKRKIFFGLKTVKGKQLLEILST